MVNVSNVLSVLFLLRVPKKEWSECALTSLREFFNKHGNIRKEGGGGKSFPRRDGEVFLESTGNCGLVELFDSLCDEDFWVFSASCDEKENCIELRFMLCPGWHVEWENKRPFEEMQRACGDACTMAGYRVVGYNNPYVKNGEPVEGKYALSINGDSPNWFLSPGGEPIIKGKNRVPKRARHRLLVEDDQVLSV